MENNKEEESKILKTPLNRKRRRFLKRLTVNMFLDSKYYKLSRRTSAYNRFIKKELRKKRFERKKIHLEGEETVISSKKSIKDDIQLTLVDIYLNTGLTESILIFFYNF
jgi:hypothetical protein